MKNRIILRRAPLLGLLCAALGLGLFLLPRELSFQTPPQEYENNEPKHGEIIFSHASGFYEEPFTLKIKAPTREIYYTLDGSEPVRGQEGTLRYDPRQGVAISDATARENVWSMRTDVTTGFDLEAVETLGKGRRPMYYQTPDYPVDKCTVLRAVFYGDDGARSPIETGSWFVGYGLDGGNVAPASSAGVAKQNPAGPGAAAALPETSGSAGQASSADRLDQARTGYGKISVISVVTDPANLFDYEKGIYVTGKAFDDFAAADSFHDDSIWYRHFWWWWDANYHNHGREWERSANVQFFGEDGRLLLQQEAGIRIQGGGSRGFLPKSLNLYARREYDGNTRFHYDFFGTGYQAKRLTLTSCGDDYYTKQKDRLVSELAAGQGFATMHYQPCLVFLDGEFWGFYYLTEKYDEKYFSYYYGVPEEDVIEIKNNQIEVGTDDDLALYQEMKAFIEGNDMSVAENYDKACGLIDMDSFLNYYAALIYCGRCGDWPTGNFALWRVRQQERDENLSAGSAAQAGQAGTSAAGAGAAAAQENPYMDGRWRWILFDVNSAAISSELQDHDTLYYVLNTNSRMFTSLSANPDFRAAFAERILAYGKTIFSPASVDALVDAYMDQMAAPMALHYRRFFGADSGLDLAQITDEEIRGFFTHRYAVVEKMLEENFQ